nr:MAG TPA: hypothetical protein [Caudoviricetes sp.]
MKPDEAPRRYNKIVRLRCPGSGCCYRRQPVSGLERCGQTSRTKGRTLWTVYRADSLGKGDAKGRCSKRKNK